MIKFSVVTNGKERHYQGGRAVPALRITENLADGCKAALQASWMLWGDRVEGRSVV